jgi:hypothetical protein
MGKPHLMLLNREWVVSVGIYASRADWNNRALDHAGKLNQDRISGVTSYHLGREMFSFYDDSPPQMMEWTDDMPNNPRSWS